MSGFQNGQWFWPNFIQINPTSPAGSTGFTEFPERLTHSYYVDLHPNSTWRIGTSEKQVLNTFQSKSVEKALFTILALSFVTNLIRIGYQINKVKEMDKSDTRIIRRWITLNSIIGKNIWYFLSSKNVFRYQNCSELLREKTVLVIEKNFWNSRLKAENLKIFWIN